MSTLTCTLADNGTLRRQSTVPAIIRSYLPENPGFLITWQIGTVSQTIYTEGTAPWGRNQL